MGWTSISRKLIGFQQEIHSFIHYEMLVFQKILRIYKRMIPNQYTTESACFKWKKLCS